MLPNHSSLKVAENFRLLEGLYPNRIDLGIGRAAGRARRDGNALDVFHGAAGGELAGGRAGGEGRGRSEVVKAEDGSGGRDEQGDGGGADGIGHGQGRARTIMQGPGGDGST